MNSPIVSVLNNDRRSTWLLEDQIMLSLTKYDI
jgi:hypothetical protein